MKKKHLTLILLVPSIVVLLAVIVFSANNDPFGSPPITGATIGSGWELYKVQEVKNGAKWTYFGDEASLDIRIRQFDSEGSAYLLYLDHYNSDDLKLKETFTLGDNAATGIYYSGPGNGPWLVVVAQNGSTYLDMAYANELGISYDGDFDTDVEWLKELAKQIL